MKLKPGSEGLTKKLGVSWQVSQKSTQMDASIVHLRQKKCWVKNWQFWWSTTCPGFFRLRRRIENLGGFWKYQKKKDESPGWWFWSGKRNSQNNPKNGRMIQVDKLVRRFCWEYLPHFKHAIRDFLRSQQPPRMACDMCILAQSLLSFFQLPTKHKK